MNKLTLTLKDSNNPLTIYFTTNLAVCIGKNSNTNEKEIRVMDGLHNNGGWNVKESYDQVIAKIDEALSLKVVLWLILYLSGQRVL